MDDEIIELLSDNDDDFVCVSQPKKPKLEVAKSPFCKKLNKPKSKLKNKTARELQQMLSKTKEKKAKSPSPTKPTKTSTPKKSEGKENRENKGFGALDDSGSFLDEKSNDQMIDQELPPKDDSIKTIGDEMLNKSPEQQIQKEQVDKIEQENDSKPQETGSKAMELPVLVPYGTVTLYDSDSDCFEKYCSLCLSLNPDEATIKIINKLRSLYGKIDKSWLRDGEFLNFLAQNVQALQRDPNICFKTITNVKKQINLIVKEKKNVSQTQAQDDQAILRRKDEKIKKLEDRIRLLNEKIKQLSEREVEFPKVDEETIEDDREIDEELANNVYAQIQCYEEKLLKLKALYAKWTGEKQEKVKIYDKPKKTNLTSFSEINVAINCFLKAHPCETEMPDHTQILECVTQCNDAKNLGLSTIERENIAREAFKKLGNKLQLSRKRRDFCLVSSKYDMQVKSPEEDDADLLRQLEAQQKEGQMKLEKAMTDFVEQQNNEKAQKAAKKAEKRDSEQDEEMPVDGDDAAKCLDDGGKDPTDNGNTSAEGDDTGIDVDEEQIEGTQENCLVLDCLSECDNLDASLNVLDTTNEELSKDEDFFLV